MGKKVESGQVPAPAMVPDRTRILKALAEMPNEAFSWFVLAAAPSAMRHGANSQIWPDGIGGFSQESQKAIADVRAAADDYMNGGQ